MIKFKCDAFHTRMSLELSSYAQKPFNDADHVDAHAPFHKGLNITCPSGATRLRLPQYKPAEISLR